MAWRVTHLVFEKDTDAYARGRDEKVVRLAQEMGVKVLIKSGRTLWDSDAIVGANHGQPTMSLSQLQKAGAQLGPIARPIPTPTKLPDPGKTDLDFEAEQPPQEPDFNAGARKERDRSYEKLAGPNGDFSVPTLEELGFDAATPKHRGGETEALACLDKIIADEEYTATFEKPKTAPTAFEPQATTLLSPHLHFGSLSIREFYWRVQDVVSRSKKHSDPPVSLTGQLLFRDMYFAAQAALGFSFSQTLYNPQARFIPWHLPSQVDHETKRMTGSYHVDSPLAEEWFQRWKWGKTGFPWIDALMRQLRTEGWIHHLGRHAVACFLTRGGCYISWERGADVFEEWLIDHETCSNAGNWQWLSCTAFFSQFFRMYSPIAFPQKWDKKGDFVRRYVPELKALGDKWIYEPWKAPIAEQKKAGVRVTGDGSKSEDEDGMTLYPKPMFDFNQRRQICLDNMKKAYHVGLYGDHPDAIDGSWRKRFDNAAEGPTEGSSFEDAMAGAEVRHDAMEEEDAMHAMSRDENALKSGGRPKVEAMGPVNVGGKVKKKAGPEEAAQPFVEERAEGEATEMGEGPRETRQMRSGAKRQGVSEEAGGQQRKRSMTQMTLDAHMVPK
jgi:cryptochrome